MQTVQQTSKTGNGKSSAVRAAMSPDLAPLSIMDADSIDYSTCRYVRVLVTPDLARQWLNRNTHNRPVLARAVDRFVADLTANAWVETHQGLAFSKGGALLDGQHRLHAIAKSGVAVVCWVCFGEDDKAFKQIDVGSSPRKNYQIIGLERNLGRGAKRLCSISGVIDWLDNGMVRALTRNQQDGIITQNMDGMKWVTDFFPGEKGTGSAPVIAGLVYAYPVDPESVQLFCHKLRNKAAMNEGDPAFALLATCSRGIPNYGADRIRLTLRVLHAVWSHRLGERVQVLKVSQHARNRFAKKRAEMGFTPVK